MPNKIYDCIQFFDENEILDLRFNILNDYVDHFVIIEANQDHRGNPKKLNFDKNRHQKFKNKIIYTVIDLPDISILKDPQLMDQYQRGKILDGIKLAADEDYIIVSDADEIPNLKEIKFSELKEKIIIFEQDHFYFKFNLKARFKWTKSKMCKKKHLKSPQWLRNIYAKKYPFYRLDALFHQKKYISLKIIKNGGWHFSYLKSVDNIKKKLSSFAHHELDTEEFNNEKHIQKAIEKKINIFDENSRLEVIKNDNIFPKYLIENKHKYINYFA